MHVNIEMNVKELEALGKCVKVELLEEAGKGESSSTSYCDQLMGILLTFLSAVVKEQERYNYGSYEMYQLIILERSIRDAIKKGTDALR